MVDEEEAMLEMFPRYVNKKDRIFTWLNDYDSEEKIAIFGDSYAYSENKPFEDKNVENDFNNKSWFGHLHHKTKKQIWNWGCGGTSLLYSKQNVLKIFLKHSKNVLRILYKLEYFLTYKHYVAYCYTDN